MQKFLRTLTLLALLSMPWVSNAQETVTIGTGTGTTYVTPFNSLWGYSFVEQIYLASEIETNGNITAVRFYLGQSYSSEQTNNITLYMKNVTRSTFSSATDYEPVTASDVVYTGTFNIPTTTGWVEILLDTPFDYDGSSNLLVAMHEYTSGYSTRYFTYTNTPNSVVTFHSDSADPDPYDLGSYSGNSYTSANRANIQLDITPAGGISCYAVRALQVAGTDGHNVTLSWMDTTNGSASYDVYQITPSVDYDSIFDTILLSNTTDTFYTISGLDPETNFRFGVAANCGAGDMSAMRYISATTTVACHVPTNVAYALTSEYSTVDLSWVDTLATAWEIRYWADTSDTPDTSAVISVFETAYSLENLDANTTYRFQVRADCGSEDGYSQWAPSNGRMFTTPYACRQPVDLGIIATPGSATEATLTWTDSLATAWQICFNGDSLNLIDVTDNSLFIDTLTAEATYTFKVRAVCGEDYSPWSSTFTFQPSLKTIVGYPQGTNSYLPSYSLYNYSLTQQIYTAAELGTEGMIMSVDFFNTGGVRTRDIDIYMVNTPKSSFDSPSDWITVTEADRVYSGSVTFTQGEWVTIMFDSPFIYTGTENVALIVDDNSGSWESSMSFYVFDAPAQALRVYSDDINYDPANPSSYTGTMYDVKNYVRFMKTEMTDCMPIGSLTVLDSLTTSESITLAWTDTLNSSATYTIYQYGADDTITVGTTSDYQYTIDNLDAMTGYTFGVSADCGSGETMIRTVSATTDCEGGSCNMQIVMHDSYGDGWNNAAITAYQNGAAVGTYTLASGNAATQEVSVCTGIPVSFSWSTGSYDSEVSFEILDGGAATVYTCTSGSSLGAGIFDTVDSPCPSCLSATNLTIDAVSTETVTISWTSTVGNYLIYKNGELVGSASDNSYTFENLTAATGYTFGVAVVCDAEDTSNVVSINVHTTCDIITVDDENPYTENFDSYIATTTSSSAPSDYPDQEMPACWNFLNMSESSNAYPQAFLSDYSSYAVEGNCLFFRSSSSTDLYAVMPQFDIDIDGDLQLRFVYRNEGTGTYNGTLHVGIMTNPNADSTFTTLYTCAQTTSKTLVELIIPADSLPEGSYLAFRYAGGSSDNYYASIDDVMLRKAPTCLRVTDFTAVANSVTAHEATFNWTSEAENFQIEYKKQGDSTWTEVAVTEIPYTLTGLDADTYYNVRMKVLCGDEESDYSDVLSIHTLISCPAPTNPSVVLTPGNGTVATLNWVDEDGSAWQICLNDDTTAYINTTATTYDLSGLTPETPYTFKVRRDCTEEEEGYSAWSNVITFIPTDAYSLIVNNGTATNGYVPIYGYWADNYTHSTFVTPASELTAIEFGEITQLTFHASNLNVSWGAASFDVYMAETTDSTVDDMADISSMTQVYSGSLSIVNNQMTVTLDAPFMYMGGNLLIAFNQTVSGSYVTTTWYGVNATGASVGGYGSSNSQQNFLPKMTIDYIPGNVSCMPISGLEAVPSNHSADLSWVDTAASAWLVMVNGDTANAVSVTSTNYTLTGLAANSTYTVSVSANCGADGTSSWRHVTFTTMEECPLPFDLNAENVTSSTATLNWNGASNYTVRYRVATPTSGISEDFENSSLNGWTTIDADGDGFTWTLGSAVMTTGYGHNASLDMALSQSYDNTTSSPLTPDNYLVSPLVNLGGSITFWAAAQDASYAAEHLGVAVSTTSNTDTSAFTTLQEWTMSASGATPGAKVQGTWTELTVDLSAYAGQTGYVAIRHFNCTDMFYLNIDDIFITIPDSTATVDPWTEVSVTSNTYAVSGLQPQTTYEFQVHASCAADSVWSAPYFFTTDSGDVIIIDSFTVTLASANATMGSVSPAGTQSVAPNASFTATATANDGYHFVAWMSGSTQVSTANPYTFTVTANTSLTATFAANDPVVTYYTVSANTADATMGSASVSPNGQVAEGSSVTFTATANSGYHFVNWTNAAGAVVSTANPYSTTVSADLTLTANFEANSPEVTYYTVSAATADATMGSASVSPNGQVAEGSTVTFTATANSGYHFVNWTNAAGAVVSTANPYSTTVTADITLTANFEANAPEDQYFTVTIVSADQNMGTVSSTHSGQVLEGTVVTATATSNSGYHFTHWSNGSTDSVYTFTVTADVNLVAHFEANVGIDEANSELHVTIYTTDNKIVVNGVEGRDVTVFDVTGRMVCRQTAAADRIEMPMQTAGVYLVKVANLPAKRVAIVR